MVKLLKRILLISLAMVLTGSIVACVGKADTIDRALTAEEDTDNSLTSEDTPIVEVGSFEGEAEAPIYVTSVGRSADASVLNALLKKINVSYSFDAAFAPDEMKDAKTIIISVGASSKGLGVVGVLPEEEKARTMEIVELYKRTQPTVVLVYVGGAARRGELSDELSDILLPIADVVILTEDSNKDGKFSSYAEQNGTPLIIVSSASDAAEPLRKLLG